MAGSKWDAVQMAPADPILGVAIAYKQDPSPNKVHLVRDCAHTLRPHAPCSSTTCSTAAPASRGCSP